MKKIKHSKFKNTGILFELLVRQITLEVLNGDTTEKAKEIVQEFFKQGTELNKELRLYDLLVQEKYSTETRAEKFIDTVNEAHNKIDGNRLKREKFNLVKKINESFDMESFLSSPISNYKVFASIYKIFEAKSVKSYDVKDVFNSKITLIENITSKPATQKREEKKKLVEEYRNQDQDIRLLTYKILVETFNKKYSNLNEKQKSLLREYINNVNNTSKFKDYLSKQIPSVVGELKTLTEKITDKVTKIKLKETISVLENPKAIGRSHLAISPA